MATEKAPVAVTGGAGFEFHDRVAARCILDLLLGRAFAAHLGAVVKIKWEVRESGQLGDDLVLSCRRDGVEREVGLSLKSDRQVTGNGFPSDFRDLAWEQWDGRAGATAIRGTENMIGLVVGELAGGVEAGWSALAVQIGESRSALDRILARLQPATDSDPGAQSSELQRDLVQSMVRPPGAVPDLEVVQLLAQTHLLYLDFLSPTSRREVDALADCRCALTPAAQDGAQSLWTWLCGFAGRKRAAGGTVDLPELLRDLRADFALRDHPDFEVDWRALQKRSTGAMEVVSTEIHGVGSLERADESKQIEATFVNGNVGILVGPSGSGKSALAKKEAAGSGGRVVWLASDVLGLANLQQLENYLGIAHPLEDVLEAAPGRVVVVVDAAERLDASAQRLVEQLLKRFRARQLQHVAVLITVQDEGIDRMTAVLAAGSGNGAMAPSIIQVEPPSQGQIDALLSADPTTGKMVFSSALRPVFRNLKVVDWVMRFVKTGASLDVAKVVNVSTLIDWLWRRPWIEGAADGDSRSLLLKRLGEREAARLSAGTPKHEIDPAQVGLLKGLQQDGALFSRDEKVFFHHDLLGDWARLRVLIGEHPFSRESLAGRARNPRWHRALQLFGVWLLETRPTGLREWLQLVGEGEDDAAKAVGDVVLEAVLAASDPAGLLAQLWPSLCAKDGALLGRLLDRFLYVCTVPDPRLRKLGLPASDSAAIEHSYRIPIGSQWLPILRELRARAADVAHLAPILVARICNLWLRIVPTKDDDGSSFPGRDDAAALVVAVVRELRGQKADLKFRWGKECQVIFEALLRSACDLTNEVGVLCLELAQRREWPPELQERHRAAKVAAEEQGRQFLLDNPKIAAARAKFSGTAIPRGRLREPWDHGPARRVPESFRSACLNTNAFGSLVQALPDVALEVLLAVCIEEPQHDDMYRSGIDDIGLAYWGEAKRSPFPRGPFLDFLRAAPQYGMTFVLRLVNFAARRQAERFVRLERSRDCQVSVEDVGVTVEVGSNSRQWLGAAYTFKWHYFLARGEMVVRALQALETWLYEQEDAGVDITPLLERSMAESEAIAFAGLLIAVGKREPKHFEAPLRPLLEVVPFYSLDQDVVLDWTRRDANETSGEGGNSDEHRRRLLPDVAAFLLINREALRPFFAELHERMKREASDLPATAPLRLLSERFNLTNYRLLEGEGAEQRFEFRWPDDVQQAIDAADPVFSTETLLMALPMQCRKLIAGGVKLAPEHCEAIWQACQKAERFGRDRGDTEIQSPFGATDAVCAGLAALLICGDGWVIDDPTRLAWCRSYLETTLATKSLADVFGADSGLGDLHWDCFAAECGLELLRADRTDALARNLVAGGVAAKRYAATELTMGRAFALRTHFPADFERMLNLAVLWADLRRRHDHLRYGSEDTSECAAERNELVRRFVSGEIPEGAIALLDVASRSEAEHRSSESEDDDEADTTLDLRTVQAAFGWLQLAGASGEEYEKWRALLAQLLNLSISHAPADEDERGSSGPYDFDYWVVRLLAQNLRGRVKQEHERLLWEPVLALGTRGNRWIDNFCATWLSGGVTAECPQAHFAGVWREMIEYAVASQQWTSRWSPSYDLARMVIALLGFREYGRRLFANEDGVELLSEMMPTFRSAAARWFKLPTVLVAFMAFAAPLGIEPLLVQGIRWVHASLTAQDPPDDDDLEAHLTDFLRACWLKSRAAIQGDHELTKMFVELLNRASAGGEHAALALRDQVLGSLA
jgi:hypothetical protein